VTSATQGSTGLADRYATALFDMASGAKALDAVAAELKDLASLIGESKDLHRLIRSPAISRENQFKALDAILKRLAVSDLTHRFVGVIAENRRAYMLQGIIKAFLARLARSRGEITAEVISAKALSEGQLAAVTAAVQESVKRKVSLVTRVDPAILGGLIVKVGSRMVDSSLQTKLKRLSLAIKGVR
jgi:F-type H+-transporting ATPase subunit delta